MPLLTSWWSVWSSGAQTCSWTQWRREVRARALEDSIQQAEQIGLSADGACRLRDILSRRVDAFRRTLRGYPPARVERMRVHLKPQAQAEKARPRRYDPVKTGWLASVSYTHLTLPTILLV